MKKRLIQFTLVAISVTFLTSCAKTAIYKANREAAISSSRESSSPCFIQKNDGTIVDFQTLELITGPFKTPYLLANGKTKIKASDIIAYQNTKHYAISQSQLCCKKKTYVSTETLPGFAVRMAKGRLNVYCKKAYNGQSAIDEFFIQSGNGEILPYTPELLSEIVKDNTQAYEFFINKDFKGKLPEKLYSTAQIYNTGSFATLR